MKPHLKLSLPALRYLRNISKVPSSRNQFHTTPAKQNEATIENLPSSLSASPPPPVLDPNTVSSRREERKLLRAQGLQPIGSRRRRAALQSSDDVPFEQMPHQCFQEARKILQEDRESKLAQIAEMRKRIAHWQNVPAADCGGEYAKKGKLVRMHKYLEELKILADINDPLIKKRFEDGEGDMNRPIYRYLTDKKWREYKRLLLMQRISQMYIVPDLLPHLDPTAEVDLSFGRRNVQPGDFVDSRISEMPARLNVQAFDKGERLVTVAVVDPDVPDERQDGFGSRCHFLASNIPISPTSTSIPLAKWNVSDHVVHPWLPPFAQKGAPYHRLAVFILQQNSVGARPDPRLNVEELRKHQSYGRENFSLRRLLSRETTLKPIGVHLFRTKWDEGTDGVMSRAGMERFNVEFTRKRPEKLPYKKKDGARYR
ncbi:mitochondrial 54S ribosomal protein YmL35 [Lecanora helva]